MTALLAGLLGSIITVVITKVLDIFERDHEHKNNLRKIIFERKINAAESAAISLVKVGSNIGALSVLYKTLSEEKGKFNAEMFSNINHLFCKKIGDISNTTSDIASTINIFFDLPFELVSQNDHIRRVLVGLSEIQNIDSLIVNAIDYHSTKIGTPEEEPAWDRVAFLIQKLLEKFEMISADYIKIESELQKTVKELRKQIKKYEL